MEPDRWTISEMAGRYGVTFRTLRFYEQRGLLSPFRSGPSRLYDARDRITMELILKGKRLGFSLREIEYLISEKTRGDDKSEASDDLTKRLDKRQISEQLRSLENRRERLDMALIELQEALRRIEKIGSDRMLLSAG